LLREKRLVNRVNTKNEKILYQIPKLKVSKFNWLGDGVLGLFDFLCSIGRGGQFIAWLENTEKIIEEKAPAPALESTAKSIELCDLKLDKFLKVPVAIYDGKPTTVEDLIDYAANVFGGAHYDPDSRNKAPRRKPIVDIQKAMKAPYPLQLAMLQPIGGIVLRGLQSLEASARARFLAKTKKQAPAHQPHVRFLGSHVF
jgi:hypothetical protein